MILSSSVDVTVKGWPVLMAAELGVSRNHVKGFIKRYIPELWKKCLIETSKIRYNNQTSGEIGKRSGSDRF